MRDACNFYGQGQVNERLFPDFLSEANRWNQLLSSWKSNWANKKRIKNGWCSHHFNKLGQARPLTLVSEHFTLRKQSRAPSTLARLALTITFVIRVSLLARAHVCRADSSTTFMTWKDIFHSWKINLTLITPRSVYIIIWCSDKIIKKKKKGFCNPCKLLCPTWQSRFHSSAGNTYKKKTISRGKSKD